MAEHGKAIDTAASAERVWALWSDTSTWAEWNPDVESISLEGPFANGVRGRMTTRSGGTHAIQITEVRPGRSFNLETAAMPLTTFSFHCEVVPGAQGSRIRQSLAMRGPLAPVMSALAGKRIAESFRPILEGLSRKAEGEG